MPAPRAIAYRVTWDLGAGYVTMPGVLGVSLTLQMTEGTTGLGWGTAAIPSASIRADAQTVDAAWEYRPVKVEISLDGGAYQQAYVGPLVRQRDDGISLVYEAGGWDVLIARARVRMPTRQRRPIATKTTVLSNEDPDSGTPGLINEVCWRAGGRPYDQRLAYPSAAFYYACDGSSIAPDYSVVDGDNPWDSLLSLAEAGAGQVYQDALGVIRFVNPLALGETSGSPPHLTNAPTLSTDIPYYRLSRDKDAAGVISSALAPFKRRARQVMQEVYKDEAPKASIPPSGSADYDLAMQWPIVTYGAIEVWAGASGGPPVSVTPTILEQSGMRLKIRVTNPSSSVALLVHRISVRGEPVTVITEGIASFAGSSVGPFDSELRLPSNDNVQTQGDAARWARMAVRFFNTARPLLTVDQCPYSPAIVPGAYVTLTNTRRGLSALGCRVTRVQVERSGTQMTVSLLPLTGLPKLSDFFIVGATYGDSDTRRYGY